MDRSGRIVNASYGLLKQWSMKNVLPKNVNLQLLRTYHPPPPVSSELKGHVIDLRSDTITKPTIGMKKAMMDALLGDDVYREDPTVLVLGHCEHRGSEVLLGDQAHIFLYEQAGMAQLGGIQPHIIPTRPDGTFDVNEITLRLRIEDVHCPRTTLICIENTQNVCGGKILPSLWIDQVGSIAKSVGIPLHMDGARLMNAVVASGESAARILQGCDTASICFSKGLGTPVGSIIVGPEEFMYRAIRLRKVLGGGMRQAGMLAAAALYALENMVDRLADDHKHAKLLAQAISETGSKNVICQVADVHTNIAIVHLHPDAITPEQFCNRLSMVCDEESQVVGEQVIIKVFPWTTDSVRFVTHHDATFADIQVAIAKLKHVICEIDLQMK